MIQLCVSAKSELNYVEFDIKNKLVEKIDSGVLR